MIRHLSKYIAFAIVMMAILIFNSLFDRYEKNGGQILLNSDFSDGLANWKMSGPENSINAGSSGEVVLFSNDPNQNIKISQKVFNLEGDSLLEITGELKTINVTPENHKISCRTRSYKRTRCYG